MFHWFAWLSPPHSWYYLKGFMPCAFALYFRTLHRCAVIGASLLCVSSLINLFTKSYYGLMSRLWFRRISIISSLMFPYLLIMDQVMGCVWFLHLCPASILFTLVFQPLNKRALNQIRKEFNNIGLLINIDIKFIRREGRKHCSLSCL